MLKSSFCSGTVMNIIYWRLFWNLLSSKYCVLYIYGFRNPQYTFTLKMATEVASKNPQYIFTLKMAVEECAEKLENLQHLTLLIPEIRRYNSHSLFKKLSKIPCRQIMLYFLIHSVSVYLIGWTLFFPVSPLQRSLNYLVEIVIEMKEHG